MSGHPSEYYLYIKALVVILLGIFWILQDCVHVAQYSVIIDEARAAAFKIMASSFGKVQ